MKKPDNFNEFYELNAENYYKDDWKIAGADKRGLILYKSEGFGISGYKILRWKEVDKGLVRV